MFFNLHKDLFRYVMIFLISIAMFVFIFTSIKQQISSANDIVEQQATDNFPCFSAKDDFDLDYPVQIISRRPFECITIKQKLVEIGASCKDGKLVDKDGKEIRFYKELCVGKNPSEETVKKHQEYVEELKRNYHAIRVECNSSGALPESAPPRPKARPTTPKTKKVEVKVEVENDNQ